MNKAFVIVAAIASTFAVGGCSDVYEHKGADGAIDHCKNMTAKKASWSSYHNFSQLEARDASDGKWVVTGLVEFDSMSDVPGTRKVRCEVFFDKGFSDDAGVRVDLSLP